MTQDQITIQKLLPCPFCGQPPTYQHPTIMRDEMIECERCGLQLSKMQNSAPILFIWNNRLFIDPSHDARLADAEATLRRTEAAADKTRTALLGQISELSFKLAAAEAAIACKDAALRFVRDNDIHISYACANLGSPNKECSKCVAENALTTTPATAIAPTISALQNLIQNSYHSYPCDISQRELTGCVCGRTSAVNQAKEALKTLGIEVK